MVTPPRLILIMGVAGSGKTTVGRALAAVLGWEYFEADDFHPPANIAKMSRGEPLDDADRAPWLAAIRAKIDERLATRKPGVFTCSALRAAYRQVLLEGADGIALVYLRGDPAVIAQRLGRREDHYMKAGMLRSQLAALEPPVGAGVLAVDVRTPPERLVEEIRARLGL